MKRVINFCAFICLMAWIFLLFNANQSMADTYCVSNEANLIAALNEAKDNGSDDVIQIQQGTYNGNFIYNSTESFGVTIKGGYTVGCSSRVVNATNTVLDAQNKGGVISLSASGVSAHFMVDGMTLQKSGDSLDGGQGLLIITLGTVTVSNNIITKNSNSMNPSGVRIYGSSAITIANNIIDHNGGEMGGGGVDIARSDIVNLVSNTIAGNGTTSNGGGIRITDAESVTLTNNIISNNFSEGGGGVYIHIGNGTLDLTNNTICYNEAHVGKEGGVYLVLDSDSAIANIYNNIIWNNFNQYFFASQDLYINNDGNNNSLPSIVNLYNNDFDQSTIGTYIKIPFVIDASNMNNENPFFVGPHNGDFHLSENSPCIDAATSENAPETDIDGDFRPQLSGYDMGADEYVPYCKADFTGDKIVDESDIEIFSTAMGETDCTWSPALCDCDIEGNDNDIDGADLQFLSAELGKLGKPEDCSTPYDDNCDGITNEENALNCTIFYKDADNDGYSIGETACYCAPTGDYRQSSLSTPPDCDDTDENINPGATENCSTAYDDNCDGSSNALNALSCTDFYRDADNDNFSIDETACYCTATGAFKHNRLSNPVDCCDTDNRAYPGTVTYHTVEMQGNCPYANRWDLNCNGQTDYYYYNRLGICFLGICDANTFPGWLWVIPGCGQEGDYATECALGCNFTSINDYQYCR